MIKSFSMRYLAIYKKIVKPLIFSVVLSNAVVLASSVTGTHQGYVGVEESTEVVGELKQPEFHPALTDFYGDGEDTVPICKVKVDDDRKNYISLTFDSAYINTETYKILDLLDKYDAKATFFMTGGFITCNVSQVREIIKRGHEVGNHTGSHPNLNNVDVAWATKEILNCHSALKEKFGIDMCLFRFPYGAHNPANLTLLKNLGYYPIQWIIDSADWKNTNVDAILNVFKSKRYYKPGNIILFHNGAKYTVEALKTILEDIKEEGLKCVRVTDLIYKEDFFINHNGVQIKNTDIY